MALFTPGPAVAQVSGRVGGTIFSHNRGGMYMRNGSKPSVVTTPFALAQKAILAAVSQAWGGLSDGDREAWREYAAANPVKNRLGRSASLSGSNWFVALNSRIQRCGGAMIDLPPSGAAPASTLLDTVTIDSSPAAFTVELATDPLPAGICAWLWAARKPSPGVTYIRNRRSCFFVSAAAATGALDVLTDFVDRFGTLQTGDIINLEVQLVDSATGLASAAFGGDYTAL